MGSKNKVVWSEGMFLQPQHFQQQDRYIEALVNGRNTGLNPFDWGFYTCTLDAQQLGLGKIALSSCQGLFADGTPFYLPEQDSLPLPLDIEAGTRDCIVYLALPVIRPGAAEIASEQFQDQLARFQTGELEVKDACSGSDIRQTIAIAHLQSRLLTDQQDRSAYSCIAVARIIECRSDKKILLDENFIAPTLNCTSSPRLNEFIEEVLGLIKTRAEALAKIVADAGSGTGGVAEVADFMLLQLCNRNEALFRHLSQIDGIHPMYVFQYMVQLAAEIATFTDPGRRAQSFESYLHDDLESTFKPVMVVLRQYLSLVLEQNAVPLPLSGPKYGVYAAKIPDRNLLDNAFFVLAVKADVAAEMIGNYFAPQTKIGPVEKIQQLVRSALPGITLHALPVAPRQIPYHAGFSYFELNKNDELWQELKVSGGVAIHIGGDFPNLSLELWAIKNG